MDRSMSAHVPPGEGKGHCLHWRTLFCAFDNLVTWCVGQRARRLLRLIAMGSVLELPSTKSRLAQRHQGLRKLSPDLISKAKDETATQVTDKASRPERAKARPNRSR